MLLAAIDSFGYNLLFLLHILTIVVAFAPGFVLPFLRRQLDGPAVSAAAAVNTMRIHGPALVLTGVFGFGLIGLSDKAWEFSQAWISVAMLLWFIMLGVLFAVLLPAEKRMGAGDAGAEKIVNMSGGILHLLFLLMVIDMIWKPGL